VKIELETVKYETEDHVAIITFGRADDMNAINAQMRADFAKVQNTAENDEKIRIIVITGSGRVFSAGTDLKEPLGSEGFGLFDNSVRDYKRLIDGISRSSKTYIAAINGFAGGVALGIALGADMAIMSNNAIIFSPFANVGLVPDGGASFYLFNALGYKWAFAAFTECIRLDAKTCLEMGMVNKVVSPEDLLPEAKKWAHSLAAGAPLALSYSKEMFRKLPGLDSEARARLESEYQNKCANSEDVGAAISAFKSKTKPIFKERQRYESQ